MQPNLDIKLRLRINYIQPGFLRLLSFIQYVAMCLPLRLLITHSHDIKPAQQNEQACYVSKCNKVILSMGVALWIKCVVKEN